METNEIKKSIIRIVIGLIVLAAALAGFYYWRGMKKVPESSAGRALEEIEAAIPDMGVPASPVEDKIPDLNPVEKTNPFKYKNPLR